MRELKPEHLEQLRAHCGDEATVANLLPLIQTMIDDAVEQERHHIRLLQAAVDAVPDHIYVKDRDHRFILANEAARQHINSYIDTDLIGKTDLEIFGPHFEAEREREAAMMAAGMARTSYEHRSDPPPNGDEPAHLLISKAVIRDETGAVIGLVGVNHNITERKQAEQAALYLAVEREKVRILNEFMRDASHEFRTPLASIQSKTYLLRRATDDERRDELLSGIEHEVGQIVRLVDSLLTISRLETNVLNRTRIETFLQDIMHNLREHLHIPAQRKDITLTFNVPAQLPPLLADVSDLNKAFANLLDNALRYTEPGGLVRVDCIQHDRHLQVEIHDTGIGIAPELLPHIFKNFYRLDEAHSTTGFGLGLPIARKIIEQHGGTIAVTSEPGKGTTFTVMLPLALHLLSQQQ